MSELPELPPPPGRSRPLPAGGLQAALSDGRRRRVRALTGAAGGGAALAIAVAALAVVPGADRADSLRFADTPTPAPTSTVADPDTTDAAATPEPSTATGAAETGAPGLSGGEPLSTALPLPSTGPGNGGARAPDAAVPPAQQPQTGEPQQRPGPAADLRPAYREDTDEDAEGSAACMAGSGVGGACGYSSGSATGEVVRRGQQAQIISGMCTSRDDIGDHVYYFNGGQEKDVTVVAEEDQSRELFRFSSTVRYVEGAHERRLRPGRCIQWTGRWDLTTTDGRPVPAGRYLMTLRVKADREVYENGPPVEEPLDDKITVRITVVN